MSDNEITYRNALAEYVYSAWTQMQAKRVGLRPQRWPSWSALSEAEREDWRRLADYLYPHPADPPPAEAARRLWVNLLVLALEAGVAGFGWGRSDPLGVIVGLCGMGVMLWLIHDRIEGR